MSRFFEKINYENWKKSINNNKKEYNDFSLPQRGTKNSAGYDFVSPIDTFLEPNQVKTIPTGVKVKMNDNEFLMIVVRSSIGFKNNIRLTNQVGIIDSDYYNNISNEGHIFLNLQNHSNEKFIIKKGDKICQGIFINYLTINDENNKKYKIRVGGIGSTNKEEKNE